MSRSVLWAGVSLLLGLALVAVFMLNRPYTFRGSAIDPAIPAADFTLTDAQGEDFTLRDQEGSLVLVFFGYTTCPDVCPATLSEMRAIRRRLQADPRLSAQAESIRYVFITVDPQRDTPERMGKYVASFDPSFVGLTGREAELEPVWKSYGVYRAISETDSAAGYLVDHTARVYLIDQVGNLRLTYAFGTPIDDMLQDVRYLLKQAGS